jgi:hypothetical protein
MGIASACDEVTNDLPCWVSDHIENGDFGRDYLKGIDQQLETRMTQLKQG